MVRIASGMKIMLILSIHSTEWIDVQSSRADQGGFSKNMWHFLGYKQTDYLSCPFKKGKIRKKNIEGSRDLHLTNYSVIYCSEGQVKMLRSSLLERSPSGPEFLQLFWRIWVQFPALVSDSSYPPITNFRPSDPHTYPAAAIHVICP